jgi:hypothetical protein
VLGAVFGAVRVLGGAKQTSKGLAWCRVLSKDKVQRFSVLCGCCAVLNKQVRIRWCEYRYK